MHSAEQWRELVEEFYSSDTSSRKSFCQENDISYSAFGYWDRKLNGPAVQEPEELQCVELPSLGDLRTLGRMEEYELYTEGLYMDVPGSDSRVHVRGRISLSRLTRIAAACQGE
ncbi:hypothetical protein L21SP2_2073 [Salinispira pacifica]|uniref:Transposase n=2 Tax=Salinispira pacifica TaxID=1307761 RepID=V5WDB0_9SPIO|nr:hypothetical protein L21SP2_0346 [Salinispira pacifica]AHC15440.1 hypothetical protein L21SP2_2073 [Salinispira pacifica]